MACTTIRLALALGAVTATIAAGAAAQSQQVYRYVDRDGHVVYSDRGPPADAKDIQAKRLNGNIIEDNAIPLAARQAQERFPVTLYTFPCGEVCTAAEGLLNRRGVPFSTVNVETPEGAEKLNKMTGELRAPVLQIGDKTFVKGYSESQWNAALDEVGYPKAQPSRRAVTARAPTSPPSAEPTTTAAAGEPRAVNAPASYPRQ
jgi:glutaredoxin